MTDMTVIDEAAEITPEQWHAISVKVDGKAVAPILASLEYRVPPSVEWVRAEVGTIIPAGATIRTTVVDGSRCKLSVSTAPANRHENEGRDG